MIAVIVIAVILIVTVVANFNGPGLGPRTKSEKTQSNSLASLIKENPVSNEEITQAFTGNDIASLSKNEITNEELKNVFTNNRLALLTKQEFIEDNKIITKFTENV